MNKKIKKIVSDHKTAIALFGAIAISSACCAIGYKLGKKEFEMLQKNIDNEEFFCKLIGTIDKSNDCHFRILESGEILKLEDAGKLIQEAIDSDAFDPYMNDDIVGLYIFTRPEK